MEVKGQEKGGGWKPSAEQELLLRAALWQNAAAGEAWNAWYVATQLTHVEGGTFRLLPLVYLNLIALQVRHPALIKLNAIYRHARIRNQLKLRRAAQTLETLHAAGVRTMVLKACALIPLYYHDLAARPMGDIDIMVPTAQAALAMQLLLQNGWQSILGSPEKIHPEYFLRMHAHTLRTSENIELDLHRHLLSFETREDADIEFWANAIPVELEGVKTLALHPADQLLHTCIHGAEWNATSPVRWVADACVLLRETEMDWVRFVGLARQYEGVVIAQNALQYLRDQMAVPIPQNVLDELHRLPVSRQERIRYEFLVKPHSEHNTALKLWYHYGQFRRLNQIYQNKNWFLRFPLFLRDTWGLPNVRAVPNYMLRFAGNWFARRIDSRP